MEMGAAASADTPTDAFAAVWVNDRAHALKEQGLVAAESTTVADVPNADETSPGAATTIITAPDAADDDSTPDDTARERHPKMICDGCGAIQRSNYK